MGQRADEIENDDLRRINNEWSPEAPVADDEPSDTAEIRAEIEQTRSQMSETIDAIQARLNPQHLGEQVKEQVREQLHEVTTTVREATIGRAEEMIRNAGESIGEARYGLMETIRHNPIPAAMAAIGLGWLFVNRRSAPPRRYDDHAMRDRERYYAGASAYPYRQDAAGPYAYGYQGNFYEQERARQHDQGMARRAQEAASGAVNRTQEAASGAVNRAQETASNVAEQTRDAAGNLVSQTRDAAGNLVSQARDTAGNLAGQAQHQARRVEHTMESAMFDNPLGVAAVAMALGAAVGLGLPQTERENQLMGETRDSFVQKAQEVAQETVEKVQRVAGDVAEQADQTARTSAREQGLATEKRTS